MKIAEISAQHNITTEAFSEVAPCIQGYQPGVANKTHTYTVWPVHTYSFGQK